MPLVSLDPTLGWDSGQGHFSSSSSSQVLHRKETSAWWHTPAVWESDDGETLIPAYGGEDRAAHA